MTNDEIFDVCRAEFQFTESCKLIIDKASDLPSFELDRAIETARATYEALLEIWSVRDIEANARIRTNPEPGEEMISEIESVMDEVEDNG